MLHGCTQTPEDFATGTALHLTAAARGIFVVYPEQARTDNPSLCWNWFRPCNQQRASGEPARLADLAARVATEQGVPPDRIFAAGLSAGGAMAAILARTLPDIFRAVGIQSGLPTGVATDVVTAFFAMRGDPLPKAEPVPGHATILHGSADRTVAPVNAGRLAGALGDTSERSADRHGRRYDVLTGRNATGHRVELRRIDGAGHGWSGGHPAGSYTDPKGPDASAEMVRFFGSIRSQRRARGPCPRQSAAPPKDRNRTRPAPGASAA